MACKFCGQGCMTACLPLEQARVVTFERIFVPSYTRERQARGYAMLIRAFMMKGYQPELLEALHGFARKREGGKKTVARALELLYDPFIESVAADMAANGFVKRELPGGGK